MALPPRNVHGDVCQHPSAEDVARALDVTETYKEAAALLNVTYKKLRYLRRVYGIDVVQASDDEIVGAIRHLGDNYPAQGESLLKGHLRVLGLRATRQRIRSLVRATDEDNVAFGSDRRNRRIIRREYRSYGPNFVWHLDGWHKLNPYSIVVHGCVDGLSKKIIFKQLYCRLELGRKRERNRFWRIFSSNDILSCSN